MSAGWEDQLKRTFHREKMQLKWQRQKQQWLPSCTGMCPLLEVHELWMFQLASTREGKTRLFGFSLSTWDVPRAGTWIKKSVLRIEGKANWRDTTCPVLPRLPENFCCLCSVFGFVHSYAGQRSQSQVMSTAAPRSPLQSPLCLLVLWVKTQNKYSSQMKVVLKEKQKI